MAGSMGKLTAGTMWRRLLVLLIVTTGATLGWVKARRRRGSMPSSWSALDSSAHVSLRPAVSEPEPPSGGEPAADRPAPGPYPGSVLPLDDGSAPSAEYVVKGNAGSMRSHSAASPYFGRTRAEVWFRTQDDAVAAGFEPWVPKK